MTEQNLLYQEAQQQAKEELIRKATLKVQHDQTVSSGGQQQADQAFKYTEIKGEISQNKNELLNIIRAISKQTYVDDQFRGVDDDSQEVKLVEDFLVQKKDPKSGQVRYSTKQEVETQLSKRLQRIRATIMFKNKILKQEKLNLYGKLNLLIKL